jgi:hypothetical protein
VEDVRALTIRSCRVLHCNSSSLEVEQGQLSRYRVTGTKDKDKHKDKDNWGTYLLLNLQRRLIGAGRDVSRWAIGGMLNESIIR